MAKLVIDNFLGGLSLQDKNTPANQYNEGIEVDPHRDLGYLKPGFLTSVVTKSDDAVPIITEGIVDCAVDPGTDDAYFMGNTRLFHMTNVSTETFNANFDGASHYYKAVTNMTEGQKLVLYNIGANRKLFYFFNKAAAGECGIYDLSSAFDDVFMSTLPAGAVALQNAPHDVIEWNGILYIANGRYLASFDGQTGANGTLNPTLLDLGVGWEITKVFFTNNFIGICAWKKNTSGNTYRTECKVFFYDGSSTSTGIPAYSYAIPVENNKIDNAINNNGLVVLLTSGRYSSSMLNLLMELGADIIKKMDIMVAGTLTNFTSPVMNAIDTYANRVIFGIKNLIFSYGKEGIGQPNILTIPWGTTATASCSIGFVRTVMNTKVFIGFTDTTNAKYYILKATANNSTRATYRANYQDFGQKAVINYIKFYFKPLVSGDVVTPTIDLDYGTSISLKDVRGNATISYAEDGAITSKLFKLKKECHSFRPCLSWLAGGTAFSKIVVDYEFLINDV